jgi:hypothetical protein
VADALKALKDFPLNAILLYQGQLNRPGEQPRVLYWIDQLKDRSMFANISPLPVKMAVPYNLSSEKIDGHWVLNAHATSEIEIVPPPGARHIAVEFGLNPGAYAHSDGVEFEIVSAQANGLRQTLFQRFIQPGTVLGDRGLQTFSLETVAPLQGTILFRTLPGPNNNANSDWSYWRSIKIN